MYISGLYWPGKPSLAKYSTVLVRFGKTQDLPGVKFKGIHSKYDFLPPPTRSRQKKRSKYGLKRPESQKKK